MGRGFGFGFGFLAMRIITFVRPVKSPSQPTAPAAVMLARRWPDTPCVDDRYHPPTVIVH